MIMPCIICGDPVKIIGSPEIVACGKDICIKTVEDHIGLHYVTPSIASACSQINRNDFHNDMFGQMHRATI